MRLVLAEDARAWLAKHGYDAAMGARPLERLIQEQIKQPLADLILFGEKHGTAREITVNLQDNKITLEE